MSNEGVVDCVGASAKSDRQNIVEGGTACMWLRVNWGSTGTALCIKVPQHLPDLELKAGHIVVDGFGAQELSCQTSVLSPEDIC